MARHCYLSFAQEELQLINLLTHNRLNDDNDKPLKPYLENLLPKIKVSSPTATAASAQVKDVELGTSQPSAEPSK